MFLMKLRDIARPYLLSLAIWCTLSLLTGWQYRIFDESINIHSSLLQMLALGEARGFTFALLTPPIFYFVRRYSSGAKARIRFVAAYCVGAAPFMVLYACIHWLIIPPWDPALQRYVPRAGHTPWELIRNGFADQITIYIALVVCAHAYVYFARMRRQEIEHFEYQQALAASELQALKMQLHPHFLFNTLHGIATLIDQEPRNAKRMMVKLSALLRMALNRGGPDLISVREELNFVEGYLDLEKMRLGPKLAIRLAIDPETEQHLVPQMILLPLVENAVRHGIANSRENGWIEISSRRNDDVFELRIRNSIDDNSSTAKGMGVGMRNTEARLKYLYGDGASFSFAMGKDGIATATIMLPSLRGGHIDQAELPHELTHRAEKPCVS
jgi:two-component system LytT family sensor kinase